MASDHPELGAASQPLLLYAENNTSLGSGNCGTGREVLECGQKRCGEGRLAWGLKQRKLLRGPVVERGRGRHQLRDQPLA